VSTEAALPVVNHLRHGFSPFDRDGEEGSTSRADGGLWDIRIMRAIVWQV